MAAISCAADVDGGSSVWEKLPRFGRESKRESREIGVLASLPRLPGVESRARQGKPKGQRNVKPDRTPNYCYCPSIVYDAPLKEQPSAHHGLQQEGRRRKLGRQGRPHLGLPGG